MVLVDTVHAGVRQDVVSATECRDRPTVIRGVLFVEKPASCVPEPRFALLDVSGRQVLELHPGPNDVSRFEAGVYFVRDLASGSRARGDVRKVVIAR